MFKIIFFFLQISEYYPKIVIVSPSPILITVIAEGTFVDKKMVDDASYGPKSLYCT